MYSWSKSFWTNPACSFLLVLLFNTGCSAPNVYFNKTIFDLNRSRIISNPHQKSIVRSYQDGDGNFYPDTVTDQFSFGVDLQVNKCGEDPVQETRANEKARQILEALKSGADSKSNSILVILIHGFNVPNAEDGYTLAREAVKFHLRGNENPVFWQVNWDGRQTKFLRYNNAWSGAQANGPLVGLNMRRVLKPVVEMSPSTPIRVITHSSGAFVAASLLGNNSNALPLATDRVNASTYTSEGTFEQTSMFSQEDTPLGCYAFFKKHIADDSSQGSFSVPQPSDIRLAVIAPATPFNSFAMLPTPPNFERQRRSQDGLLVKKLDLIVGLNEDDVAVTKGFLPSSAMGATTLGANLKEYFKLERALEDLALDPNRPREIKPYLVNFGNSATFNEESYIWWDSHDLSVYLKRDGMPKVLRYLFGSSSKS